MQNSENDPLSLPFAGKDTVSLGENRLIVVATVAAVVLAGSAFVYRHTANLESKHRSTSESLAKDSSTFKRELEAKENADADPGAMSCIPSVSSSTAPCQELGYNMTTGNPKSSRSKDRRKRGKDPLREVLRSGKKLKSFPIPTATPGSLSTPSSPKPTLVVLDSTGKGKQSLESPISSASFDHAEAGSSTSSHSQSLEWSQESRLLPTERWTHEQSGAPLVPVDVYLNPTGHLRPTSDVSETSRFTHEEDDLRDDGLSGSPSHRQYLPLHDSSLNQASLPLSRPPSSLADVSEVDPEEGSWMTSVSKLRSRNRARLGDVVFEEELSEVSVKGGDQGEEEGMPRKKEKARGTAQQESQTLKNHSVSKTIPDLEKDSRTTPNETATGMLSPPSSSTFSNPNSNTDHDLHQENPVPASLLSNVDPPPEKSKVKRHKPPTQRKQEHQHSDLWNREGAAVGQSTSIIATRGTNDNEIGNTAIREPNRLEKENGLHKKPVQSPVKGGNKPSYASLVEGGNSLVIGQCRIESIKLPAQSNLPASGSGVVDGEAGPSAMGANEAEKEFTFPTLNPTPGSTRTRPALSGNTVSSSPSKKNRRSATSSNKNGASQPNGPPSRTSSPSNAREQAMHGQGSAANSGTDGVLSAQTQLASLRGALEAARLREEKHKLEIEKATKDVEILTWERNNSRKGEAELQSQVRQLMQQLQSYAALFASVAPHLSAHLQQQMQPLVQLPSHRPDEAPVDGIAKSDPSPKADRSSLLSNGAPFADSASLDKPSTPQEGHQNKLTQEVEEAVSSSASFADKAQVQNHVPLTPTSPQTQHFPLSTPSPSQVDSIPSPLPGEQQENAVSPPSSASIPSPFFPYAAPSYLHTHHPHFPLQSYPWITHHYQSQQAKSTNSAPAGLSHPLSPVQHYSNMYSPMVYPMGPVPPPLSPPGMGMMSPQLLHQHQSFGFGGGHANGLQSTGPGSAGSYSPELTGPSSGVGIMNSNRQKPKMKRRKSQMANLNRNARMGWEDVGDGWIGLSNVVTQASAEGGRRVGVDEIGVTEEREGEDDNAESASSPYSELLADAILKRSSTIRSSRKNGKRANETHDRQEGAEEVVVVVDHLTEFTFPSLSDLGNVCSRTTSTTESSISSSLSSSPPSTTTTVPDSVGDGDGDDEGKAEESLGPSVADASEGHEETRLSKTQEILVGEQATRKDSKKVDEASTIISIGP